MPTSIKPVSVFLSGRSWKHRSPRANNILIKRVFKSSQSWKHHFFLKPCFLHVENAWHSYIFVSHHNVQISELNIWISLGYWEERKIMSINISYNHFLVSLLFKKKHKRCGGGTSFQLYDYMVLSHQAGAYSSGTWIRTIHFQLLFSMKWTNIIDNETASRQTRLLLLLFMTIPEWN